MSEPSSIGALGSHLLATESAGSWMALIDASRPATLLVAIDLRIGPQLRPHLDAEDIWQETLLHAWRDRAGFEWRGLRSFRRWLLQCAENCIRGAADRATAARRGGGVQPARLDASAAGSSASGWQMAAVVASATPSRNALLREQIEHLRVALDSLPEEERDVVRLRVFDDCGTEDTAKRLGISVSAVKRRFRSGIVTLGKRLPRPGSSLQ